MNFFQLRESLQEAPEQVIVFKAPFQLFDKDGKSFQFELPQKYKTSVAASSNDRFLAIAGDPKNLEKMLKTDPMLKGKVDVDTIMKGAVKFTGKEKFGRNKGANFKNYSIYTI